MGLRGGRQRPWVIPKPDFKVGKILITGTSRGLGKVAAEEFSKDGWEVLPLPREKLNHVSINPSWMIGLPEDVDVVLHCAGGGLGLKGPYLTPGQIYELFMVNLGGAMEINRRFGPLMQAEGYGRIIHVASIASGQAVGSVGYNTVKTALAGYIRSLGREMAPYGVVVTGIAPGGFWAPHNAMVRLMEGNPEAYEKFIKERLPRGFMGEADELIPLLKFLASPQASMMGGCLVPVDAGEGFYYG